MCKQKMILNQTFKPFNCVQTKNDIKRSILLIQVAMRGCPRRVVVKAMDCGIVVSEFLLQSCYYVHFRANSLGKGMNPLILAAMG